MPRFTFKKNERLCSLKAIDHLYQHGSPLYGPLFKAIFFLSDEAQPAPCQVVFSVPKKSFKKAVNRNLLKRRLREAYRINKELLYEPLMEKNAFMHLMFIYTAKEIKELPEIEAEMQKILKTLAKKTGN